MKPSSFPATHGLKPGDRVRCVDRHGLSHGILPEGREFVVLGLFGNRHIRLEHDRRPWKVERFERVVTP